MSTNATELSVSQARDHFSDAVNRAIFAGEITYVTRGRNQQRAAAIVPAELVERYEAMIDLEDGRVARERLADLDAGRTTLQMRLPGHSGCERHRAVHRSI
jgi:PHD/YefM family antitoxin component YafN of YafNO toxin-antitoxin module